MGHMRLRSQMTVDEARVHDNHTLTMVQKMVLMTVVMLLSMVAIVVASP